MADFIVVAVVVAALAAAVRYIIKEKKRGVRCIGCPNAGICASKNRKDSGCGDCSKEECHREEI